MFEQLHDYCSAAKSASVMVPSNCGDIDQGSLYGPWDIGPQASKSFAIPRSRHNPKIVG